MTISATIERVHQFWHQTRHQSWHQSWRRAWSARRAERRARREALRRFALQQPQWHDSLFDAQLLRRPDAAAALAARDAAALARAWTEQFRYRDPRRRERDVRRLAPVAEELLRLLAEVEGEQRRRPPPHRRAGATPAH